MGQWPSIRLYVIENHLLSKVGIEAYNMFAYYICFEPPGNLLAKCDPGDGKTVNVN